MFLQIGGGPPLPTPWYKENPVWAGAGIFFAFVIAGLEFGLSGHEIVGRWLLWCAWPFGAIGVWATINGLTKDKTVRTIGRIIGIIIVGALIWHGDRFLSNASGVMRSWRLVSCAVVKDGRVREGQSVQLILRGPTEIKATVWENQCRIPIGTVFHREGGSICNPIVAGPHDVGCFGIDSETKRTD